MILKNNYKKEIADKPIEENVKQVILGSALGDGRLAILRNGINAFYVEIHCLKQKEYLLWKKGFLDYFDTKIREGSIYDKRTNKVYKNIMLWSKTHPFLTKYQKLIYKDGKKHITKEILTQIEALGLAIWYMDDGYYQYGEYRCGISTNCFPFEEQILIKEWIKEKFDINAQIHRTQKRSKFCYTLIIPKKETNKFFNLIEPFVISCMYYKLGHFKKENLEKIQIHDAKRNVYRKLKYQKNKMEDNKRSRNYYKINKAKVLNLAKNYYLINKEKILNTAREYYLKNRLEIRVKQNRYNQLKREKLKKQGE